jgi:prepilin-type N-terminal cleavage/methylation domain-containing protein
MIPEAIRPKGFTLLELLIAVLLVSLIIAGSAQLAQATSRGFRLQQNLAALQENARFGLQMIQREVSQAGFRPAPWQSETAIAAVAGSLDDISDRGDRLVVRRWSVRNCFGNANPVTDPAGRPRYFLRITAFEITAAGQLSMNCEYGPDAGSLTRQINGLGLVEHAVALQLLFAEDSDADRLADRWVKAGHWTDETGVLALQLAILLASPDRIAHRPANGPLQMLGDPVKAPEDGRLYRVFQASERLRGRAG